MPEPSDAPTRPGSRTQPQKPGSWRMQQASRGHSSERPGSPWEPGDATAEVGTGFSTEGRDGDGGGGGGPGQLTGSRSCRGTETCGHAGGP